MEQAFPVYDYEGGCVVDGYRVNLMKCPACWQAILGREELVFYREDEFGDQVQWAGKTSVAKSCVEHRDGLDKNCMRLVHQGLLTCARAVI